MFAWPVLFLTSCFGLHCDDLGQDCDVRRIDLHVDGSWPAGDYVFEVGLDGRTVTCHQTVPFSADDGCDSEDVRIDRESSPSEYWITAVEPLIEVDVLSLRITLDGEELVSEQWQVEPEDQDFDGDPAECDQPCTGWVAAVDVQP